VQEGRPARSRKQLMYATLIIAAYFGVEAAGALISGSLALLADVAHTGSDVAALGLALFASWVAAKPHSATRSFGFLRAEVLSALVNGAVLFALTVFIFVEAVQRLGAPPEVRGGIVSIVASGGLVANVLAAAILLRNSHHSLNTRAALFHVGSDALGSAGAIVAGLLVLAFDWQIADPIVSMFIGLILVVGAVKLVSEATHVLLEGTPAHIDMAALRADLESLKNVTGCHDLHTWTITSGYEAMSAHVTIADSCTGPCVSELQSRLRGMAQERYGIAHLTIQVERVGEGCEEEAHVPELLERSS
jgi:cobalt-zinc-cadmium efflux system protein